MARSLRDRDPRLGETRPRVCTARDLVGILFLSACLGLGRGQTGGRIHARAEAMRGGWSMREQRARLSQKKWKTMTLDAMEFIRRFLQHVLPSGFMKIRHYGFLNPNCSLSIEKICELISLINHAIRDRLPEIPASKKQGIKCTCCGNALKFIAFLKPIPACRSSG